MGSSGWFSLVSVELVNWFHLPVIWVCVIGFCVCAVCWSTPVYYFIRWRRQVTARLTDKVIAKAVQENNEVEMKDMKEGAHENKVVPGNGESVVSVPQQ